MSRAVLAALLLVLAACSSASSTPPECFTGSYAVTFGAPTGDPGCPTLAPVSIAFVANANGTVSAPAPQNSTSDPGNVFDENTCKANYSFTGTASSATGCPVPDHWSYQLAFTPSGLSGQYSAFVCAGSAAADGGAPTTVMLSCAYAMTGAKK